MSRRVYSNKGCNFLIGCKEDSKETKEYNGRQYLISVAETVDFINNDINLDDDTKSYLISEYFNKIRNKFDIPNKLICLFYKHDKNNSINSAMIILFDIEPDGNVYHAEFDEEKGEFYIEIDD